MTLRKPWVVGLAVLAAAVYLALWVGWSMQWGWLVPMVVAVAPAVTAGRNGLSTTVTGSAHS